MALNPGTRIGPYEIVAPLGAGGMGEVYRAKDTRLGRDVAVKVLPAEVASDPERLRRFEQEAKAVSALNHPHIVTLYEVGESASGPYLVLEKIDGQSLRELLRDGALPVRRVLTLGAQIAEGLAKAHAAGIVHRDLKPENVMVTADGFAKILDFGLAKLVYPELETGAIGDATTLAEKTGTGMILGTLGYLSPEQAVGKPADFRSDQFALGALLYELATGERPFRRETTPESLAAVIREEPESLRAKNVALPAQLGWIVERCLSKEPSDRYASTRDLARDLGDLRDHLSELSRAPAAQGVESAPTRRLRRDPLLWLAICAALAALVSALGWRWAMGHGDAAQATIIVERLTRIPGVENQPAISPDGKSVVYVHDRDLWLLRVGGSNPINLTAEMKDVAFAPTFSPDGQQVAFNTGFDGDMFVMGATGENARRVNARGFRPSWTPDGKELVFAQNFNETAYSGSSAEGLEAVDLASGRSRKLCACVANAPVVSPGGKWVAYWGIDAAATAQRDLWLVPFTGLDSGREPLRLTDDAANDWNPAWSADGRFLYFLSDRGGSPNLWRVPFDEAAGRARGKLEAQTLPAAFVHTFDLAADGRTIVFASQTGGTEMVRIPFDSRTGLADRSRETTLRLGDLIMGVRASSFSPDGEWLAVQAGQAGNDLVLLKVDGSAARTLVPAESHRNRSPSWSPDGRTIAFATDRSGKYEIWGIAPDGSAPRPLLATDRMLLDPFWSPDGSLLVAAQRETSDQYETLIHRAADPPDRFERLPALPDGDWFNGTIWSLAGDALIGPGGKQGIWRWSLREHAYRELLSTGAEGAPDALAELPDGRLLISFQFFPGVRVERFDPVSGKRELVLEDEARIAAPTRDAGSLWLNRWKVEADLWIARFESPER